MNRRRFLSLVAAVPLARYMNGGPRRDRVIVVGAGIIGASVAYHMAKRGADVVVVERERPAAGASGNSFAWLNAGSKKPGSYYELNLLGMLGWRRLERDLSPRLAVQWGGSVQWLAPSPAVAEFKQDIIDQQRVGYSVYLIDQPGIAKLLPGIESGPVGAACFADQEGTIDPVVATQVLLSEAQSCGARFICPCDVTGFDRSLQGVRAIQTSQGSMEADFFVLAAGNGIPPLAKRIEMTVPLVESPGVLAHTKPQARLLTRVVVSPNATLKQNLDGRVVTGTNFGGTPGVLPTHAEGNKLLSSAEKYLPTLHGAELDFVTLGHRVMPQDGHSIVGSSSLYPNVYVIATHSGMTLAPILGQLAASEVLDGGRVDLLAPYRPQRFV
jgi:glycine/D-amino acid oxidase-like deaminating enzyme